MEANIQFKNKQSDRKHIVVKSVTEIIQHIISFMWI